MERVGGHRTARPGWQYLRPGRRRPDTRCHLILLWTTTGAVLLSRVVNWDERLVRGCYKLRIILRCAYL